jgi:hypothetical protein
VPRYLYHGGNWGDVMRQPFTTPADWHPARYQWGQVHLSVLLVHLAWLDYQDGGPMRPRLQREFKILDHYQSSSEKPMV